MVTLKTFSFLQNLMRTVTCTTGNPRANGKELLKLGQIQVCGVHCIVYLKSYFNALDSFSKYIT